MNNDAIEELVRSIIDDNKFIIHVGGTTAEEVEELINNAYDSTQQYVIVNFDKTWLEIYNAYNAGKRCIIVINPFFLQGFNYRVVPKLIGCSGDPGISYCIVLSLGESFYNCTPVFREARCSTQDAYPAMDISGFILVCRCINIFNKDLQFLYAYKYNNFNFLFS